MASNNGKSSGTKKMKGSGDSHTFHECLEDVISLSTDSSQDKSSNNENEEEQVPDCNSRLVVESVSDSSVSRRGGLVKTNSVRAISRRVSREFSRRRSSLKECLPDTPVGWTVLTAAISSAALGYEIQLQQLLTSPPLVFGQCKNGPLEQIYSILTKNNKSILSRRIRPSLFVGTRGILSSGAAYAMGGPSSTNHSPVFREVLTASQDGAKFAIDWELPRDLYSSSVSARKTHKERQVQVLKGPIHQPVVLILHGINNDASFGYMRSLMRTCTNRGWIAVGMNFRGCGGVPLATPRNYTGAYTGDLRHVVRTISARLDKNVPMFLVGNSLGANIVTKYLGEEGLSGSLPECVAGGISLGNPLAIHPQNMKTPWKQLLSLGARKGVLENWKAFRKMTSDNFQRRIRMALCANTIGNFDEALAPTYIRNERMYPFTTKIGYSSGEEYWDDGSSYKVVQHVSVPLLKLISQDDFLVYGASSRKMSYCLENPNVLMVTTKCGGHLGWHESPPDTENIFGFGTSWADTATADFIEAILSTHPFSSQGSVSKTSKVEDSDPPQFSVPNKNAKLTPPKLRSRL